MVNKVNEISTIGSKGKSLGKIVAGGMLRQGTPIEYYPEFDLFVKREDKACIPPGPPFSKARGVYAHILSRSEKTIGVLDTRHSQAGHAVAMACKILDKVCVDFYPEFKYEPGPREPQHRAVALGAKLFPLPAGRSAILYHAAKKEMKRRKGYMMPNALKLKESVTETAREVYPTPDPFDIVIVPISSGTIAAGVIKGFSDLVESGRCSRLPFFIVHLGYSRSHDEVNKYLMTASGVVSASVKIVDEKYQYKDVSSPGVTPPFPCNEYYDLKAFRWWMREGRERYMGPSDRVLFWNIG